MLLISYLNNVKASWKQSWNWRFIISILIILILIIYLLITLPGFFDFVQNRKGIVLGDLILSKIPSADLSWIIFPVIQFSVIIAVVQLLPYPDILIMGIRAYILVMILRMLTIYIIPLEPPQGIVLLDDPLNEVMFYGHKIITKDLFFSGHVSTIYILFLTAQNRNLKRIYFLLVFLVAGMILIQHVHYTIDVVAAPFFTWFCYKISTKFSS